MTDGSASLVEEFLVVNSGSGEASDGAKMQRSVLMVHSMPSSAIMAVLTAAQMTLKEPTELSICFDLRVLASFTSFVCM